MIGVIFDAVGKRKCSQFPITNNYKKFHFKGILTCLPSEFSEKWETIDCLVTEGPFVLKYNGKYYLTYSANHTRSEDYAIGYAISESPMGPFTKYENNPILHKNEEVNGTGHHSFFHTLVENNLVCVYHSHFSKTQFQPRLICIDKAGFEKSDNGDDILVVYGPTHSPQKHLK